MPHLVGLPLLALDLRGHGDSPRPGEGYDVTAVAADLGPALDALGWSRAVLVGHSWGAAVAAAFAADHPERSLALVCIDGGFNEAVTESGRRAELRERLRPPALELSPEDLEELLRVHTPTEWSEELARAVLPIFELGPDGLARARLPVDVHMEILDGLLTHDGPATLARVRCPTWLVTCEPPDADPEWTAAKARTLDRLARDLDNVRAMRWGGAVHDVPLQWPALVAGLIRTAAAERRRKERV